MDFDRLDSHSYQTDLAARHRAEPALIFKHSPTCGVSARALKEVERYRDAHPETTVYLIDVIRERAFSLRVAGDLQIGHASPQVIVVREGQAAWSESHWRIDADTIADAVDRAAA